MQLILTKCGRLPVNRAMVRYSISSSPIRRTKRLREEQNSKTYSYTNALHDALTKKDVEFRKCWRSKFGSTNKCTEVEGCVDSAVIVNKFADYFSSSYTCKNKHQALYLREQYLEMRSVYSGCLLDDDHLFETE